MHKIIKLFIVLYCGCSAAETLYYQQLSPDTFQFILTSDVSIEIGGAQSSVYSAAVKICNGKKPSFGKYSFDSSEPVSGGDLASSFTFIQEIKCTDEVASTASPKRLDLSIVQEEAVKSTAKKKTEEFLSAKEAREFENAYNMLGSDIKGISKFSEWSSKQSELYGEHLGKRKNSDIWRVTLYNNPPNSPKPGLYSAVDYENSYEKSPIFCGYIVWHTAAANAKEFTIIREEYGNITTETLNNIPAENLPNVRKQIGCRAL